MDFTVNLFYDRVELDEALSLVKPPATFLDDTFFGPSRYRTTTADTIAYDVRSGSLTLAPYIHPRIGNKVIERGSYATKMVQLPTIAPSMVLTPDNAKQRLFGEMFNSPTGYAERLRDLQIEDVVEMRNSIRRRREQQVASLITTGKIEIKGDGIDAVLDLWAGLSAAQKPFVDVGAADANNYWSGNTANPIGDLTAARDRAARAMGATPDIAILGKDAAAAILEDEKWLKLLDNRGVNAGYIDVAFLPNGVTRLGYVAQVGLTLYTYSGELYDETTDTVGPIIPDNYVILANRNADTRRYFGQVAMTQPGIYPPQWDFRSGEFNVNSYMQTSPEQGMLTEVKCKTIPVIRQIQEFQVLQVLAS